VQAVGTVIKDKPTQANLHRVRYCATYRRLPIIFGVEQQAAILAIAGSHGN